MDKKKLMLLLGAMVIAVGTALAARSMLSGGSTAQVQAAIAPAPTGPKVLVAQRSLPVGTIIALDAVSFQAWPKDMVQDAYFIDGNVDKKKLIGTVVRYPITAGQPLTQGALVAPGDRGFLAAALGAGMRAVSIPVSDNTGVAGFVFPGDHVDLMLTQAVQRGGSSETFKATETVLRNIRVLATDQSTESEVVAGKTTVRTNHIVTIEVTPRIAEKVQVAQTLGTLSLALRSIADNQTDLDRAIASGAVKVPEGASKAEEERMLAKAYHTPTEGATSFSTGGDVSRFSRKTLPAAVPTGPAPAGPLSAEEGPMVQVVRGSSETKVPIGSMNKGGGVSPARAGGQ